MSKKQKSVLSADFLKSVDKALNALEKSRAFAKKQAKQEKKAILALLELEALIEDANGCECTIKKKKKKKTQKKSKKQSQTSKKPTETVSLTNILGLTNTLEQTSTAEHDDLELIAGVGAKLAETLNSLGIYQYEQIANWNEHDIEQMDAHLNFTGRIVRDNWVEQAKALANGGHEEYVKVFGKEPR